MVVDRKPTQSKTSQANQQENAITRPQLFVVTFVGWLILQMFSPKEWRSVIGSFLTVESTVLFLLNAIQQRRIPNESTIQFLLAAYLGYFILYQGNTDSDEGGGGKPGKAKSGSSA